MKTNAYVAGIGMTPFARYLERPLKSIAGVAISAALKDAGLEARDIQAAYMGNAVAGLVTGQEMIRGEVVLRSLGMGGIPVINIENACASSSTALQQACAMITAGFHDVVLVCGYEKLSHHDKAISLGAFSSAVDVEDAEGAAKVAGDMAKELGIDWAGPDPRRSVFMDIYAMLATEHMQKYGSTQQHFAQVAVKNSLHGSLNPRAQFNQVLTIEEVLGAREIINPLTLPMCSPLGDGAAAVVLVSERKAKQMALRHPVKIIASALTTGLDQEKEGESLGVRASQLAYNAAGIGPEDLSLVELHDASAPSEIMAYEYLGLCEKGAGAALLESGATQLGGAIPVNTSGGLLRKGHPVGATGCAQIVEITEQLRGHAGARQVANARFGLAHNAGGAIGRDAAVMVVTILARV